MRIGYSCWGFLGKGIIDTPDGGRSHRFTLLKELVSQGSNIIMLQKNRDLVEAKEDFSGRNLVFNLEFPKIDALFLEYRWRIPGRNCNIEKNSPLYAPDLDRQNELLNFYQTKNIPIIVWDKDQELSKKDELEIKNIFVFEPALKPRFNRKSLLFPIDKKKTEDAFNQIKRYSKEQRTFKLVYIGNQYERDNAFKEFIDLPASKISSEVPIFGNWSKYPKLHIENLKRFPYVKFKERIGFEYIEDIYKKSLTTVLIAPNRYYKTGHFTQRLFESMWGLCIPLIPSMYYGINSIVIKDWIVNSGNEVIERIKELEASSDSTIQKLFRTQFKMLNLFKADRQAKIILDTIKNYYG